MKRWKKKKKNGASGYKTFAKALRSRDVGETSGIFAPSMSRVRLFRGGETTETAQACVTLLLLYRSHGRAQQCDRAVSVAAARCGRGRRERDRKGQATPTRRLRTASVACNWFSRRWGDTRGPRHLRPAAAARSRAVAAGRGAVARGPARWARQSRAAVAHTTDRSACVPCTRRAVIRPREFTPRSRFHNGRRPYTHDRADAATMKPRGAGHRTPMWRTAWWATVVGSLLCCELAAAAASAPGQWQAVITRRRRFVLIVMLLLHTLSCYADRCSLLNGSKQTQFVCTAGGKCPAKRMKKKK